MPGSRDDAARSVERFAPSDLPMMSAREILERRARQESPILIDVRTREEMSVSMIPEAMTRERFEALAAEEPSQFSGRTLVPYCTVGARSGQYARQLLRDGHDVRNGEGILLWTHDVAFDEAPLVAGEVPTRRVHVFGAPWDLGHPDYEPVRFGPLTMALRAVFGYTRDKPARGR